MFKPMKMLENGKKVSQKVSALTNFSMLKFSGLKE